MFKEMDVIALTTEVPLKQIWDVPSSGPPMENRNPGDGLKVGDIGTVVYVQGNGEALEVEFLGPEGNTIGVATISPSQARLATKDDLKNRIHPESAGGPALSLPEDRTRTPRSLSVQEDSEIYNPKDRNLDNSEVQ